MKKILTIAIISLVLVGNTFAGLVGSDAPDVKAQEWINSSGPVSLEQFKDKVVVVEFWATWCPPCLEAIPHLVKLYNKNKNKGLVVISLTNEKRKSAKIDKFMEDKKMNYIVGTGSTSGSDYSVRGIPRAFVIVDGKIIWEGHPVSGLDEAVKKALEEKAEKKV
jgi:thiol-disulfide isomerase/thioredoxin